MTKFFDDLCAEAGMRPMDLARLMERAPVRYKVFAIPKRNGQPRIISQPAREVKRLQRIVSKLLLDRLPVHDCAMAYRTGVSILDNAKSHAASGPILKMDLKDFFPSIKARDWARYCRRVGCLTEESDIFLTSRLLFRREPQLRDLRLAIGAPSSPVLSNVLMFEFDRMVTSAVEGDHVTYTRYADDLTFSAPRTGHLVDVIAAVRKVVRDLDTPRLAINEDKTTYITKKYHRAVTGLTLSNDGRVTIGRDKKRLIRATIHRAITSGLEPGELQMLTGMLAYVNAVEPSFLDVLHQKYGEEVMQFVKGNVKIGSSLGAHRPPIAKSNLT